MATPSPPASHPTSAGSLAVPHRNDLPEHYPSIDIRGYDGISASLLSQVKRVLADNIYKPDYLLLNAGLHDVYRKVPKQTYLANLQATIDLAKKHNTQIIWVTITPRTSTHSLEPAAITFNQAATELMKNNHIPIIDLHHHTLHHHTLQLYKIHGTHKILHQDQVHFTPKAYQLQAKHIAKQLKALIK